MRRFNDLRTKSSEVYDGNYDFIVIGIDATRLYVSCKSDIGFYGVDDLCLGEFQCLSKHKRTKKVST